MSKSDRIQPWWQDVFVNHESRLIAFVAHITRNIERAREIVQEAFLRLCGESRDQVEAHVVPWLYTVCRNLAIDSLRKESRMTSLDNKSWQHVVDKNPQADESLDQARQQQSLDQFIETLPAQQQEILRLKFHSGLSYREISAVLGLSESNVGFILSTALKTIRACWTQTHSGEVV